MGTYQVEKVEAYLDHSDTNALQLYHSSGTGDFIIATCTYLENDPELDAPQFTLGSVNDQSVGENRIDGEIDAITVGRSTLTFDFAEPFKGGEQHLVFAFANPINEKMIDFLVNKLFLGEYITYDDEVDEGLRIQQSEFREEL